MEVTSCYSKCKTLIFVTHSCVTPTDLMESLYSSEKLHLSFGPTFKPVVGRTFHAISSVLGHGVSL